MSKVLTILNRIFAAIILLVILLLLAVWAFSPIAVRHYAPPVLSDFGLEMDPATSIRLNPFKASITIRDFGLRGLADATPQQTGEEQQNEEAAHENAAKESATKESAADEYQARISYAAIDVSLLPLMANQLAFDELSFEDILLNVHRDAANDTLTIAGYTINNGPSDEHEQQEPESEEGTDQTSAIAGWTLSVPALGIDNFTANIFDKGSNHQINLNELQVTSFELAQQGLNGRLGLEALLNTAPLKLDLEIDLENTSEHLTGQIVFASSLDKLAGNAFSYLVESEISKLGGNLNFDLNGTLTLKEKGMLLTMEPSYVELQQVDLSLPDIEVRESSLKLSTSKLDAIFPEDGEISAEGVLAIHGQNLELGPNGSNDILVAAADIDIPNIALSMPSLESINASIESIAIKELRASQKAFEPEDSEATSQAMEEAQTADTSESTETETETETDNGPALVKLASVDISQIQYKPQALSIESIVLAALQSDVLIDANQQLSGLVSLQAETEAEPESEAKPEPTTEVAASEEPLAGEEPSASKEPSASDESLAGEEPLGDKEPSAEQSAEGQAFAFSLGSFTLNETGKINLIYEGSTPHYRQSYTIDKLILQKLNTAEPESFSHLELAFSSGNYTGATLVGELASFAEKTNMTLELQVKEFDLPNISPFVRNAAGFDMANGQLDTIIKVSIVNDEISGNAAIEIRGLEIENATDVHTGSLTEQTFIPLNVALSALKDSDGRIELDIPLKGNVNDPDFGVNGFFNLVAQRAAMAASQSYLINTFVPYANIVTLTTIAGSYALKPRVDDLLFAEKQKDVDDEQKEFLSKIAALLTDKESIDMQVCGYATPQELKLSIGEASAEQLSTLRMLAHDRATAVKSYLVKEHDIASARVLICKAKVDQREEAQPRVEFVF